MMSAVWTVILKRASEVAMTHEYAPRDSEQAKNEIQRRHPGCNVIALVLGLHTSVYTFSESAITEGDYYDPQHNQPTGGSD